MSSNSYIPTKCYTVENAFPGDDYLSDARVLYGYRGSLLVDTKLQLICRSSLQFSLDPPSRHDDAYTLKEIECDPLSL